MMNKFFAAAFICLQLLLLTIHPHGAAAGEYTLTGSELIHGNSLVLSVNIEHATNILGGEGVIEYDSTLYRLVEVRSVLPQGYSFDVNDTINGRLPFMFFGREHIQGSFSLLELDFVIVREPADGNIVISLSEGILSDGETDTEYSSYLYTGSLIDYVSFSETVPPPTDAPQTERITETTTPPVQTTSLSAQTTETDRQTNTAPPLTEARTEPPSPVTKVSGGGGDDNTTQTALLITVCAALGTAVCVSAVCIAIKKRRG